MTTPLVPSLPREIQLEVTGACNLACKMCLVRYRPKLGKREGAMCFHTFKRIVDDLPELEQITLQGLGEPLLAPDLFTMIQYASERGIRMGFNTNGTLLTRERARRLITAGLNWLHISLDGATAETYQAIRDGSDFETVARNVVALVEEMRDLEATLPRLSLVFVAMRRNIQELPAAIGLAAQWGVERLWVQNLSHSFSDTDSAGSYAEIRAFATDEALWADGPGDSEEVFAEASRVAEQVGVELRLPRLRERVVERGAGTPGCHWPFESAYVTHDAKIQPCCMVMGADRAVLGDAETDGFEAVWKGSKYRDFRAALLSDHPPEVCAGCSAYRRLF